MAPIGPGVYELRRSDDKAFVLVGCGKCVAARMSSLLPAPLGQGKRNNSGKRDYVLEHLPALEYRCCACKTKEEAKRVERERRDDNDYLFPT